MDECHTFGKCVFHLKINLGHSDIFHCPVIFLLLFFALKNILVLLAKLNSDELRCPATALNKGVWCTLIHFYSIFDRNSVDPDQTPHSAAADLGLHCLPMSL